jgi:hypothetical protein
MLAVNPLMRDRSAGASSAGTANRRAHKGSLILAHPCTARQEKAKRA